MTTTEFSNEFDTLVDSYRRFKDFDNKENLDSLDFNEYEKSVYLTQAQESIVIDLYSGRNMDGLSFEKTEEVRRYLNELVKTFNTNVKVTNVTDKISENSIFFKLPIDILYIVYEAVGLNDAMLSCSGRQEVPVVPVTHDEYQKVVRNPFRKPNDKRVLRIDAKGENVELISQYTISDYIMRYLKKPTPIILLDLPNDLTINEVSTKQECELNPAIHRVILEKAVQIAITSKLMGMGNNKQ